MSIPEEIINNIKTLPKSKQKTERDEDIAWSGLSIASAIQGMETEEFPYTQDDLKEIYQ